ncbi:hypothetical protein MHM84_11315 [Halomonas sp. McH1-25]|uniref:hypothetical protein n=1 Tax=unclassified Halomonas TaxID=2609666 RepID=UPI001EF60B42|nr:MULTISPECIES: hypothetical protein [unclassified Halomonas]MCG7600380.1 hypothetical protein [Halomonas sp. McH1-25]MCP1344002.1 hypothetical protein [Halomonas sp. FL8]MCP1361506.1 hypothetical protein [Halomonas sp. BBD45]MCP1367201.1 hypothetical protein [Halomonas sp. BBD48]
MSDFDRLIRNLSRAGALAARARQGDKQVIDELIDSLRAYAGADAETYEGEASTAQHAKQPGESPQAGVDKTIADYRATKEAMASIIDKHMLAALEEIEALYGTTPTDVTLHINQNQPLNEQYPRGTYAGSDVRLGGE